MLGLRLDEPLPLAASRSVDADELDRLAGLGLAEQREGRWR